MLDKIEIKDNDLIDLVIEQCMDYPLRFDEEVVYKAEKWTVLRGIELSREQMTEIRNEWIYWHSEDPEPPTDAEYDDLKSLCLEDMKGRERVNYRNLKGFECLRCTFDNDPFVKHRKPLERITRIKCEICQDSELN